jgi:hypothetical protein
MMKMINLSKTRQNRTSERQKLKIGKNKTRKNVNRFLKSKVDQTWKLEHSADPKKLALKK